MKRVLTILLACLVLGGVLLVPASADSAASSVELLCTVNSDGSCLVTATILLRLEAAYEDFYYPVPVNAKNISLNGSTAHTVQSTASTEVDISKITRGYTGDASIRLEYTIPDVVTAVKDETDGKVKLQMDLPLLSGFQYPVESLSFTVTMPTGTMSSEPRFTSIYQNTSIENDLKWEIRGSQIIGSSTSSMNDREGVDMILEDLPTAMFPGVDTYIREGNPELVPMLIFAALALVYWVFFLRALPILPTAATTPPAGVTAGELGCHLTMSGCDLTGMVFSWAQMGYVLIHLDGSGRVLLHKRMDMGNERSQFENKIFKALFGNRRVVDGTGIPYAQLSRRVAGIIPNERMLFKRGAGNPRLFRLIACVSQIFCGICVAMNMTSIRALEVILAIILGIFGAVSAWFIQGAAYRIHLRGKRPIVVSLALVLVWVLLGVLCGQVWIPLGCAVGELLMGFLAAYGGRRSELGRLDARQVLGFRRFLRRLPNDQVPRLMSNDPDYFFNQAPYALAMGVILPFSRSFSRRKLDQCPYLITQVHGKRTAEEWARLMMQTADLMDARARSMELERWLSLPQTRAPARRRSVRRL